MSPEQKFSRWVRTTLIIFVVMFVYFIVADTWMPQTPESTVMRTVTPVASRVSGYVTQIFVHNNSVVKKGDPLFSIDRKPYEIQVSRAEIDYQQAGVNNRETDAQIDATRARIRAARLEADNNARTWRRFNALRNGNLVSQQDIDKAWTAWQSAVENIANLNATLNQLLVTRGQRDDDNITLRKYRNLLEDARLNLSYTTIYADSDGVISNLQLKEGWYANAGTPAMALVNERLDIVADFREKSLSHTHPGTAADVVFDGLPGRVFKAKVVSRDAGILQGQQDIDGHLSQPENSNRWVRDAQRMRIHVALDTENTPDLPAGARATVQLYNSESNVAALFSRVQIKLVSYLHYVY